jgi:Transposase DDE domain
MKIKRGGIITMDRTISQGVRAFGLRRSRYIGMGKTHLQRPVTAAAINLKRVSDWLAGGRSWENEALGIRPCDATANRLIVDSVDHGIRQQYPPYRKDTFYFFCFVSSLLISTNCLIKVLIVDTSVEGTL